MALHDTVDGWRFWYTRPDEDPLTLYSPQIRYAFGRRRDCDLRTSNRIMRARCPFSDHAPPAAGCKCGVYACANVVDALYRMRAMTSGMRQARAAGHARRGPVSELVRRAAEGPDGRSVLVLTEVACRQPVTHNDKGGETPVLTVSGEYSMLGREVRCEVDPDTGRNCSYL